jgi:hypothetical protein
MNKNYAIYVGGLHPDVKEHLYRKLARILNVRYIVASTIQSMPNVIYIVIRNNNLRIWAKGSDEPFETSKARATEVYQKERLVLYDFESWVNYYMQLWTKEG